MHCKRVKLNIIGLIVGFIFVAMITIIHKIIFSLNLVKDQEMDNVLKIVIIESFKFKVYGS